jgi:hypothetical protein
MAQRKSSPPVSKPITSPAALERLKEEKRERNRLNKQRSKAMERRVAKYLAGDRTPLSGAGASKGDVVVPFTTRPGRYLVECKLTEQFAMGQPCIKISKLWLKKIQQEAEQMRALFGVLVIHYHNHTPDFVIIRGIDLAKVCSLDALKTEARFVLNKPIKTVPLYRTIMTKALQYPMVLVIDFVVYYVLTLAAFKEIIDGEGG